MTASPRNFDPTNCSLTGITGLKKSIGLRIYQTLLFDKNTQEVQTVAVQKFLVIRKGEALQITLPNVEGRYDLISFGFPQVFRVIFLSLYQTFPITLLIQRTHTVFHLYGNIR